MSGKERGFSVHARVRARRNALQALYEQALSGKTVSEVTSGFAGTREMKKADVDYFHMLLNGIEGCRAELDRRLIPLLDRDIVQLDPITHSVLLIGLYELLHQSAVPAQTVINEAVELAKMFGAEDSYKFVNGVLDKAARQLRAPELKKR